MVIKRKLWSGGLGEESSDSSEFREREFKRKYGLPSLLASVNRTSPQELGSILEPFIRTCVREEIELALKKYFRPSLNDTTSCGSRNLQLHFENKLPGAIFNGCKVESENSSPIKVVLRDVSSGKTITSGPLSSAKLTLVVLDGDLNPDDCEDLTLKDFNKRTVREREGKRPLVTGTRSLTLIKGVGYVGDISFTDNSSWIRSGKFRLGVTLHNNNTNEIGVKEGISNAFKVLDQRGESNKKNHPPSLVDEVWRLEKIAKDGASHKRLAFHGIFTVKDFLRLYHTDSSFLRSILGSKTSNKIWDLIIGHAKECCLDKDELYVYSADDGTRLLVNSVYEVVGVILDGLNFQYMHSLNQPQKNMKNSKASKSVVFKEMFRPIQLALRIKTKMSLRIQWRPEDTQKITDDAVRLENEFVCMHVPFISRRYLSKKRGTPTRKGKSHLSSAKHCNSWIHERLIENLKLNIYKNPNHLVPLGGESFFTSPLQSSRSQASCFSAPSIMLQNGNFTKNQDENEMQINSCPIHMSPMHVHGFKDKNELQVSVTETCGQTGECSPTFSDNDFVVDGSFSGGQTLGFDWDANGFSLGPLDLTCPHIVNENFEAWQGNNFIVAQGNEEFGLMTANFDIHVSRYG